MDKEIPLIIKWSGKEYEILIEENKTVSDLKREIAAKTSVKPERQKLLNLKVKGKTEEQCKLGALQLKPNFKIMMMGSLEEDIQEANTAPKDLPQVLNDFDIDDEEIAIENRDIYLNKVARRVKEYEVKILNQLRPGVDRHPSYKIAFYMDSLAMISVQAPKYGMIDVKPLGVIWGKFEQYTPKNTIMFDDIRRNFIMNPKNGLKIRPFREAHKNRCTDNELLRLSKYIKDLAKFCDDFTTVNHKNWEKYKPKGRSSGEDTESDVRN
ncbi:ubiquitin-like domain-containing CTD phosphatase 1 isoform X2 [Anthonomus grandis grandis]|uniref:ubiquitin-like domain-containing CTD phosphatase 1 isoform X2 n=1 Tax=Anthonomus grandis grandis TaxID=2921223 RepID=UPI0021667CFE|nr:ubiquitin-like domain-containing CTD phosphatase 1 isoform X2 [Anthonomus grandis grandis]